MCASKVQTNFVPRLVSRLPRPVGLQVRVPVVLLVLLVLLQPQRAHVCGRCRLPLLPLLADGGGGQRGHDGGGGGGGRTVAKSSVVSSEIKDIELFICNFIPYLFLLFMFFEKPISVVSAHQYNWCKVLDR